MWIAIVNIVRKNYEAVLNRLFKIFIQQYKIQREQ